MVLVSQVVHGVILVLLINEIKNEDVAYFRASPDFVPVPLPWYGIRSEEVFSVVLGVVLSEPLADADSTKHRLLCATCR